MKGGGGGDEVEVSGEGGGNEVGRPRCAIGSCVIGTSGVQNGLGRANRVCQFRPRLHLHMVIIMSHESYTDVNSNQTKWKSSETS